jgi:hypothetical protein
MYMDWFVKRAIKQGIRQMFKTYFTARSRGGIPRDALWAVVLSRFQNDLDTATTFWHGYWSVEPSDGTSEDAELQLLIGSILRHDAGPTIINDVEYMMHFEELVRDVYNKEVKG